MSSLWSSFWSWEPCSHIANLNNQANAQAQWGPNKNFISLFFRQTGQRRRHRGWTLIQRLVSNTMNLQGSQCCRDGERADWLYKDMEKLRRGGKWVGVSTLNKQEWDRCDLSGKSTGYGLVSFYYFNLFKVVSHFFLQFFINSYAKLPQKLHGKCN